MARASNGAVVGVAVSSNNGIVWPAKEKQDFDKFVRLEQWEDGVPLQVRVEPEEEAWRYPRLKFYWGYLVEPFCEASGYSKVEADKDFFKPHCMPEGKFSLHDLSEPEMVDYLHDVERTILQEFPSIVLPEYKP
jgi:hypothetical protein